MFPSHSCLFWPPAIRHLIVKHSIQYIPVQVKTILRKSQSLEKLRKLNLGKQSDFLITTNVSQQLHWYCTRCRTLHPTVLVTHCLLYIKLKCFHETSSSEYFIFHILHTNTSCYKLSYLHKLYHQCIWFCTNDSSEYFEVARATK